MKKQYHRHIDNGGITVEISFTQHLNSCLAFTTNYHGYPSVASSLQGLTKEDLREVGLMLLNFAADMNDYEKE